MNSSHKLMRIKALSPDNSAKIRELVKLFQAAYGSTFPIGVIYDEQYWRSHIGSRFTSLVIEENRRIVGHVALYPDPLHPENIQVCLPVLHPSLVSNLVEYGRLVMETIDRTARRQNWKMIYFFTTPGIPGLQTFATQVLKTEEVAILPGYFPHSSFRARGLRTFHDETCSQIAVLQRTFTSFDQSENTHIYVPEQHASIVEYIYSPLNLARTINACDKARYIKKRAFKKGLARNAKGIQITRYARTGNAHIFLKPSLVSKAKELSQALDKLNNFSTFVFCDLQDPNCPEIALQLEQLDYRLSGVIPLLKGSDYLIYHNPRFELSSEQSATSMRHQVLAEYIRSYSGSSSHNSKLCSRGNIDNIHGTSSKGDVTHVSI